MPKRKPKVDPYRPRKCRLCGLEFKPTCRHPTNADGQLFCCASHRKEFWMHGKATWPKLILKVEKEIARMLPGKIEECFPAEAVRAIVREELEAMESLNRLRSA